MSARGYGGTWQQNGGDQERSLNTTGHGADNSQSQHGQYQESAGHNNIDNDCSTGKGTPTPQQPAPPPSRSMSSASGRRVRQRGSTWRESNANGPPRRMEMAIPQNNLRVFASAIQCLMKVGKELFIEATADQLILRTLNDAKSAFAAFYFNDAGGFFESFRCEASRPNDERTQERVDTQGSTAGRGSVSCKVPVRAVHSVFRTLKKVVRLVVYVEGEDDEHIEPHLVFQMYCEYGYRKVHRFSLQDCEIMHAVFEGEEASRLSCPPVQLSQLLEHIHGTAEVAVGASHDVLTVRSFHHPLTGSAERAVLKTEMSISTAEFDTYSFFGADDEEVELVFSLKEIKALLHFCETTEAQSLEMLFREGGDPLLFQSHSNMFAGELIMATMEPKIIRDDPVRRPGASGAEPNCSGQAGGSAQGRGGPDPGSRDDSGHNDDRRSSRGAGNQPRGEEGDDGDNSQQDHGGEGPECEETGEDRQQYDDTVGQGEVGKEPRQPADPRDRDEWQQRRQRSGDDEDSQSTRAPRSDPVDGSGGMDQDFTLDLGSGKTNGGDGVDKSDQTRHGRPSEPNQEQSHKMYRRQSHRQLDEVSSEGERQLNNLYDNRALPREQGRSSSKSNGGREIFAVPSRSSIPENGTALGGAEDSGEDSAEGGRQSQYGGRNGTRTTNDVNNDRGLDTECGVDTDQEKRLCDGQLPQSEMPTPFPGLRAAFDSVSEGSLLPSEDVIATGETAATPAQQLQRHERFSDTSQELSRERSWYSSARMEEKDKGPARGLEHDLENEQGRRLRGSVRNRKRRFVQDEGDDEDQNNSDLRL